MFDGITVTTFVADLELILPLIAGGVVLVLAPWGARKIVGLFKGLMGR